jgi:hypothetical protein
MEVTILQEELERKSVALATKTAKLTAHGLAKLMRAAMRKMEKSKNKPVEGKQTVQQLAKGGTLENIEITDENIKAFEPYARKFNVSYSLQRDNSEKPPKWLVFFRAKDSGSMNAAFKAFMAQTLTKEKERPKESVHDLMSKFREMIRKPVLDKVRHKEHER